MNESRPTGRLPPALVLAVLVSAVLAVYVAGYFWCGSVTGTVNPRLREFRRMPLCILYAPMAMLEARVLGVEVWLCLRPADANHYSTYWSFEP